MITGLISFVILIAVLPPAINNGEWGVVAVVAVVVIFLLALGAASREDDRAYINRTKYWADGGPDGATRHTAKKPLIGRKKWEETERNKELVRQELERIQERQRMSSVKTEWLRLICPNCKTTAMMRRNIVWENGKQRWEIYCPICKQETVIPIE